MVQVLQGQHIRDVPEPLDGDHRAATQGLALSVVAVVLLAAALGTAVASDALVVALVGLLLSLASATVGVVLGHVTWRSARRRYDVPFGRTVATLVVGYGVAVPGWLAVVGLLADLVV